MSNNYTSSGSNLVAEQGYGEWAVVLYNPEGPCGLFKGHLVVAKDFHTIYGFKKNPAAPTGEREKKVMASFPSQNVAFVYDQRYIQEIDTREDDAEETKE